MITSGPNGCELAQLRAAAQACDADRVFAVYEAVNARLGVPAGTDPAWAMRLLADGAAVGLVRLAGARYFAAVPLHADTTAAACDRAREGAAA
jgi:hypothetical protein